MFDRRRDGLSQVQNVLWTGVTREALCQHAGRANCTPSWCFQSDGWNGPQPGWKSAADSGRNCERKLYQPANGGAAFTVLFLKIVNRLLQMKLFIFNVRAVSCRTIDADDISADRAVSSRRNRQHRGHDLDGHHVRVHELDEHLGVADIASCGMLPGRCHRSLLLTATTCRCVSGMPP